MADANLRYARDIYLKTRHIWFADSLLDAHERLGLITVAAGLRKFAFLNHLKASARNETASFLSTLGFQSQVQNARFDINVEAQNATSKSTEAYILAKKNEGLTGLGVLLSNSGVAKEQLTLTRLGSVLEYPQCCVRMDIQTKEEEHRLSLQRVIEECGEDPVQIADALKVGYPIENSYPCMQEWGRRFQSTMERFPFVLHTACDECLGNSGSPAAILNSAYERLAKEISDELHFLVRWAAHIMSGRADR